MTENEKESKPEATDAGTAKQPKAKKSLVKYLFKDKRSYKRRLLLATLPVVCLLFTLIVSGPFELALSNSADMGYPFFDILISLIVPFVLSVAIVLPIIALIKGRTFNFVVALISGITLASFVQGGFLNGSFSEIMTGDALDWSKFTLEYVINTVIWVIVIAAIITLSIVFRKHFRKITSYPTALILIIELVLIVVLAIPYKAKSDNILSKKGEFTYSKEKNTVVFLLDRFDYDYVIRVRKDDPDFFECLEGFTEYTNCISAFARTKPGANYLLTNAMKDIYVKPADEFYKDSWTEKAGVSILDALKGEGYSEGIYGIFGEYFSDGGSAKPLENYLSNGAPINHARLFENLMITSAYKYFPAVCKKAFWYSTNDVTNGVYDTSVKYDMDDSAFYYDLKTSYSDKGNAPTFRFYHLFGPHAPYHLRDDGTYSSEQTSLVEQTKGVFTILNSLFDEMKKSGIYENTEIIITADHGNAVDDTVALKKATCIALFYKPAGVKSGALKKSDAPVSQDNIPATILKGAGYKDYKSFGTPLDEVKEDDNIIRYYYKSVQPDKSSGKHETQLVKYEVIGDAKNFDNWKEIETITVSEDGWFY